MNYEVCRGTFNVETEDRLLKMFCIMKHVELCVSQREETNLVPLHRHLLPPVRIHSFIHSFTQAYSLIHSRFNLHSNRHRKQTQKTYIDTTKLPSHLRPTTRECVHLVIHGHFRSHDKDGGHSIRSAISEKLMLHANFTGICVIEAELLSIEVLHCGNRDFRRFLLP